jgi:AcrR family transcriptional regulator
MTQLSDAQRGQRLPRAARRAQLLDAARSVFVAAGYHAAAMDDIADRAGVSKPVLYQHFPGKLDLYLALLDQSCDQLEQLVRDALALPTDGNKGRVEATVGAYFDFVSAQDSGFRMVFESDLTNDPQVRNRIDGIGLTCAEAIADVIAADTGISDDQAMLLGVALAGLAQVSARYWLAQGQDVPKDEASRLVSRLAWGGIGSVPVLDRETSEPATR